VFGNKSCFCLLNKSCFFFFLKCFICDNSWIILLTFMIVWNILAFSLCLEHLLGVQNLELPHVDLLQVFDEVSHPLLQFEMVGFELIMLDCLLFHLLNLGPCSLYLFSELSILAFKPLVLRMHFFFLSLFILFVLLKLFLKFLAVFLVLAVFLF
jgi:hypothetical protein